MGALSGIGVHAALTRLNAQRRRDILGRVHAGADHGGFPKRGAASPSQDETLALCELRHFGVRRCARRSRSPVHPEAEVQYLSAVQANSSRPKATGTESTV